MEHKQETVVNYKSLPTRCISITSDSHDQPQRAVQVLHYASSIYVFKSFNPIPDTCSITGDYYTSF